MTYSLARLQFLSWYFRFFFLLIFLIGLSSSLKYCFTSSWRILCFTGGTGYCIPNGYTSMFTVSIMSKWNDLCQYPFMSFLLPLFHMQICYTIWTDFWVCPSCWNLIPRLCHNCGSSSNRPSPIYTVVMDGIESLGDGWGSQWIPFPMEPIKLLPFIWRVSYIVLSVLDPSILHELIYWHPIAFAVLNSMTTIIVFFSPSQGIIHQLLFTWTG